MTVVTIWQGVEAGRYVVKLFSESLPASNSIYMKFSYTAAPLSFSEIKFAASSSSSDSSAIVNGLGTTEISGQFSLVPAGQPFATLVFSGAGNGNFDLNFSTLSLNGQTPAYLDPPAQAFSIINIPDVLNILLNEDGYYTAYSGSFSPLTSYFETKLSILKEPAHGKIYIDSYSQNNYNYVPDQDFYGVDSFKIFASDGKNQKTTTFVATVLPVNDAAKGTVSVSGDKLTGTTVTASNDLSDPDGMGVVQYSWQKSSDGTSWLDIPGANTDKLNLASDLSGQAVRAVAHYKDQAGVNESVASRLYLVNPGAPPKIITGTPANDLINNTQDAELVDGGSGRDTFVYAGARADYAITQNAAGFNVQLKSQQEASDTLNHIERLQFSDRNVALDIDGNAGQVYRLYQAAFGRTPDLEGLGYWIKDMDQGSSLTSVAAGFFQSAEFQKLYGSNPSISALLNNLYQNVLHRAPDQAGFEYWNTQLSKGQISAAGVLASFCESAENQAQVIGSIKNGIDYQVWAG
ncbi:DUF4214 domain-containing protein [Undibacterium sp. Di27W]|uniref:DUF4214 domain-containing protein n=1 Tax=Undibacterium sp. Di27W TaxID=3413036 RepID=UPI003BF2D0AD